MEQRSDSGHGAQHDAAWPTDEGGLRPLRLVVVGAGFMGKLHAKAIADSDVAVLAGIVDVDPSARDLAAEYNVDFQASVEPLLDSAADVDGFVVCLPDRLHVDATCAILRSGRAVLLEKPIADSREGALRIAAAEREGSGRLLVAHILRFDPRYAAAAAAVADGELGDVLHLSSGRLAVRDIGRRMNGASSVQFYLGVHDVDLVQWISGRRIVRVCCCSASKLMPALGVDSEDVILTNAELEDGIVAQLYAGWTLRADTPSPINARTSVVGTAGALEIDVRDHGLRIQSDAGLRLPDAAHWPLLHGRLAGDLAEQLRHFAVAVRTGAPFLMSVAEAVSTAAVNDAILRAVRSGRAEDVAR